MVTAILDKGSQGSIWVFSLFSSIFQVLYNENIIIAAKMYEDFTVGQYYAIHLILK